MDWVVSECKNPWSGNFESTITRRKGNAMRNGWVDRGFENLSEQTFVA